MYNTNPLIDEYGNRKLETHILGNTSTCIGEIPNEIQEHNFIVSMIMKYGDGWNIHSGYHTIL